MPGSFDALVCLWQSFGYFDEDTNAAVVQQIGERLVPGGRFVLDIYHRSFFEAHEGTREFTVMDTSVVETKAVHDGRLAVELTYEGGTSEDFEWQVYTPEEIRTIARGAGFQCVLSCACFDEQTSPTPTEPRMQLVFEKR